MKENYSEIDYSEDNPKQESCNNTENFSDTQIQSIVINGVKYNNANFKK